MIIYRNIVQINKCVCKLMYHCQVKLYTSNFEYRFIHVLVYSHCHSCCLLSADDPTIFLHFCQSSAALTHAVIPIPSPAAAMSVSQVFVTFLRPHALSTKLTLQANPGSYRYGQTAEVSSDVQLPEASHSLQSGLLSSVSQASLVIRCLQVIPISRL